MRLKSRLLPRVADPMDCSVPFLSARASAAWAPSCLDASGVRQLGNLELRRHEPILVQLGEAWSWAYAIHGHGWVPSALITEVSRDTDRCRNEMSRSVTGTVSVVTEEDDDLSVGPFSWVTASAAWDANVRSNQVLQLGCLAVHAGKRLYARKGARWSWVCGDRGYGWVPSTIFAPVPPRHAAPLSLTK